jgi:hypothetical protein
MMQRYDRQTDASHANAYDNQCYSPSTMLQYEKHKGKG